MINSIRLRNLWFWLCILLFNSVYSQNYLSQYEKALESHSGDSLLTKVNSIIDEAIKKDSSEVAIEIAHSFSIKLYRKRNYKDAITQGQRAIGLYEQLEIINKAYLQEIHNVALFHFRNENYVASIRFHQKAVDQKFDNTTMGRAYFELGNCYFYQGDYYKAIDYYKIGIIYLEKSDDQTLLVRRYLSLANRYEEINSVESLKDKLMILLKAEKLMPETKLSPRDYSSFYNNFATYYNNDETFDFEKSKFYQKKFLENAFKGKSASTIATSYANLGNLYSQVMNDSAYVYFEKALELYEIEEDKIRTYNNLAYFHLKRDKLNMAVTAIDNAIAVNIGRTIGSNEVPTVDDLKQVSDKYAIIQALRIKASALIELYSTNQQKSHLNFAMEYFKVSDTFIDLLLIESAEERSKLHWREQASTLYSAATWCAFLLNDNEGTFYFNEKNKALLLTENVLENSSKSILPQKYVAKELELKKVIFSLENLRSDDPKVQEDIFLFKKELDSLQKQLKKEFPENYGRQNNNIVYALKEVQKQLDPTTVIASYVWDTSDSVLPVALGIFITKENVNIIPLQVSGSFSNDIFEYRKLLSKPFNTTSDRENFEGRSKKMFQHLFPTKEIAEMIKAKNVIVVPSGEIQNIPFEPLISSSSGEYLLLNTTIHYAYSISFLLHNSSFRRDAQREFAGFSPVKFKNQDLDSLTNSEYEIEQISEILDSDKYLRENATKQKFLDLGNSYKIIHLATHADATLPPWIAFNDSKLELHELYTFRNQAELVVLSACNTSLGQIAKGEGVMSLARGFFYSGTNSVVASLWNVNDKSTANLLSQFYLNLKQGQTKSEALRQAKITYIKSNSLSEISPYYWASFVLIGDSDPIVLKGTGTPYNLMVPIAIILIIILLLYFGRKLKLLG